MIIGIQKQITCTNSNDCGEDIRKAIELEHPQTSPQSYHIDIDHTPNLHRILICFYDNPGIVSYQDPNTRQEVTTTNGTAPTKRKATGIKPKSVYETRLNSELIKSTVMSFIP